jgi:hypothetical protein
LNETDNKTQFTVEAAMSVAWHDPRELLRQWDKVL